MKYTHYDINGDYFDGLCKSKAAKNDNEQRGPHFTRDYAQVHTLSSEKRKADFNGDYFDGYNSYHFYDQK